MVRNHGKFKYRDQVRGLAGISPGVVLTVMEKVPETEKNKCVSGDSKTVFESSRTKRAPEQSETVLPFLNGGSHN